MLELTDGRLFELTADRFKLLRGATNEYLREVNMRVNGFILSWETLDENQSEFI